MKHILYYIVLFLLMLNFAANAQYQFNGTHDSIVAKKGSIVVVGDSVYFVEKDTVFNLIDSTAFEKIIDLTKYPELRNKIFYDTLKARAKKKWVTNELFNLIVTLPETEKPSLRKKQFEKSEDLYIPFREKYIRNIKIKRLNVFGSSIDDTLATVRTWIGRTGNNIHIKTRKKIIENNLIFHEKEKLNPYIMADNERILRDLPFIEAAKILVDTCENNSDSVDVIVLVKDLWSIGGSLVIDNIDEYVVRIYDDNFGGFGRRFFNKISVNPNKTPSVEYEGEYIVENIGGSFIRTEFSYQKLYEREYSGIKLTRPFVVANQKHGGSFELAHVNTFDDINIDDTSTIRLDYRYQKADLWYGRAFKLCLDERSRKKFVLSERLLYKHFTERPFTDININEAYQHKLLAITGLTYLSRNYYRGHLIYGFGHTEDIPYGWLGEISTGVEFGEYSKRYFLGGQILKGDFIDNFGYLYGHLQFGDFFKNGSFHQGQMNTEIRYFSNLFQIIDFKFRQFVTINYQVKAQHFRTKLVELEQGMGLRGTTLESLDKNQILRINLETVAFLPPQLYGFRFALFSFLDLGIEGSNRDFFKNDNTFFGFGLGIRIRNENLVFKTIQLKLAYFPMPRFGKPNFNVGMAGKEKLRLRNFDAKAPPVFNF